MSAQRLAYRYAKSVLDLAIEQGLLEAVKSDMDVLKESISNRDLFMMIKSPIVSAGKKKSVMKAIFGDAFQPLTTSFFNLMIDKGREAYLPEIADAFLAQYKSLKNISTVKVITAVELSEEAIDTIRRKLLESDATHNQIEIVTEVNPEILGGFMLEFDDKLFDASVAHKLDTMKKQFSKNSFVANM